MFSRVTSSAAKTCKIYRRMTNILPQELITEILSLLLVKPLLRFQCVSKAWFVAINDPDFIKMHLNRSIETNRERALIANYGLPPQTYDSINFSDNQQFSEPVEIYWPFKHPINTFIRIVGNCNGLVCIHICLFYCSIEERIKYPNEIVIWNPLIRKHKKLPFKPIENPDYYELGVAFGYDQINDDYKVVRILKPRLASVAQVGHHVYSLRGNSWRKGEDKWPRKDLYLHMHCSASFNGALHWVAGRRGLTSAIVAFDLSTEKYRVHALPIEITSFCAFEYNTHLVVLGGYLCVWEAKDEQFFDVWVMKEYGVAASNWTRLYRLPQSPQQTPSYFKPLALSNNGEEVLMVLMQKFIGKFLGKLYWYNIKKKRSGIVEIQERIKKCELNINVVVGSLLLLDGELDH